MNLSEKLEFSIEFFLILLKRRIEEGDVLLKRIKEMKNDLDDNGLSESISNWHKQNIEMIEKSIISKYKDKYIENYKYQRYNRLPASGYITDFMRIPIIECLNLLYDLPYKLLDD